eukprot:scaffold117_cov148-Amphora_coffeaeformis.AAC.3
MPNNNNHSYGQERYETQDFQTRVRHQFDVLQQLESDNGGVPWHVVPAGQSMDDVERDIWQIVQAFLAAPKAAEVGKLWVDDNEKDVGKDNAATTAGKPQESS